MATLVVISLVIGAIVGIAIGREWHPWPVLVIGLTLLGATVAGVPGERCPPVGGAADACNVLQGLMGLSVAKYGTTALVIAVVAAVVSAAVASKTRQSSD